MSNTRNRRKAAILAAGLGVLGSGGVLASAASLGTLSNASLGSGVQVVASCDTDGVTVGYTNSFDPTTGKYTVASVSVSGISTACAAKRLGITLKDSANAAQGTGSVTSVGSTGTESVMITGNTDAGVVTGAAIVIAD